MKNQTIFTKDNLKVTSVEYDASPSGEGIIFLHLDYGSVEIDVESYLGVINIKTYSFVSDIVHNKFYYYELDDESVEVVQEYMKSNSIFDSYMDEVYEAVNKTF